MAKKPPHSWSKEFQKRRQMFAAGGYEEGEEQGEGSAGGGAQTKSQMRSPREVAEDNSSTLGMRRIHSPPGSAHHPPTSPLSPLHQHSHSGSWTARLAPSPDHRRSSDGTHDREIQRSSLDGQRGAFDADDDDQVGPLHSSPGSFSRQSRQTSSHHRFLAAETGQKERVVSYGETTSPAFSSQSLSDDAEDNALTAQIAALTTQNHELLRQLHDHEQERDRLREQLETQRPDRSVVRPTLSPTALPSKLLDGRFLREVRGAHEEIVTPSGHHAQRQGAYGRSAVSNRMEGSDSEVGALHLAHRELEMHLQQAMEEKRRIESELARNRDVIQKVQAREQDLAKDIATLRNENSHHTGAIAKLSMERDRLQTTSASLQRELTTVSEKLKKTEKCYREVEHENLGLEADIDRLVRDKKQLSDELEKLQRAVEDALKTKENYRSTIKQLREANTMLQTQLGEGLREPKVVLPKAEKPPRTLDEVMSLREEKNKLKAKLLSAQEEIESLEANLKAQVDEHSVDDLRKGVSVHLSDFQAGLAAVSDDLESTRCDLVSLSLKQHLVMKEGFTQLAEQCREQLTSSHADQTRLRQALELSEQSLQRMVGEVEALREENSQLRSQKASISVEVSSLQSDVAAMRDQKRLLEIQVTQNNSLAEEKEKRIHELEVHRGKMQDRLATTEKAWKSKCDRLDQEWQGRMAEADLISGQLSVEVESLHSEKAQLEETLGQLQLENEKLVVTRSELESRIASLESTIDELAVKVSDNTHEISTAERTIARLLAEKACIVAQVTATEQAMEAQLTASQQELEEVREATLSARQELNASMQAAQAKHDELTLQLSEISKKAAEVDQLTTQIATLTTENSQLRLELELASKKHEDAVHNLQELSDKEQKLALENEKIKMTLSTEIGLLKSKLKSVEEEKQVLEDRVLGDRDRQGSAFHVVSEGKNVEQFKKHLQAGAKQQKGGSQEHIGQLSDLQASLVKLETENQQLKDAVRSTAESAETAVNLRKQLTELSRKAFFLEAEKNSLAGKVQQLQNSQKAHKEERSASEHLKKLQVAHQALQDRLRALEESHTRKMMAADLKVLEAVRQSDALRCRLGRVREQVEPVEQGQASSESRAVGLADFAKTFPSKCELLQTIGASLTACRQGLQCLESEQLRIEAVQLEIQQALSLQASEEVSGRFATLSRSAKKSPHVLPPVLQALPPDYLSSLQGRSSRPRSPSQPSVGASNLELREKLSQLHSVNLGLAESLKKHWEALQQQEEKVSLLYGHFSAFETTLDHVAKQNHSLQGIVLGGQEFELKPEQLQTVAVLQKQIENLQDQVIDRDVALQDIDFQMRKDYEMHDWKFTQLKSSVFGLREQLSAKEELIRTKDQYVQQVEESIVDCEGQLLQARKELDRVLQERTVPGLPDNVQMADVIRAQGEEVQQLRKVLTDFSFDLSQLQTQLDAAQREKSILQSKVIDMERMHVQVKEAMNADVVYLRKLNLQLVEQQMKAEKAREVLQLVRDSQDRFKEQKSRVQLEAELDNCKLKLHEQERKISDLEGEISKQRMTIKVLQVEKDHALLLSQHTQDMLSPMPARAATGSGYVRPRSADNARKPKYRISESFKSRGGVDSRNIIHRESDFSIVLPAQNSHQGSRVDILNLEEQAGDSKTLSLGPMVVTDDEASYSTTRAHEGEEKKPQRVQKLRMRGHRRSASSGSNILPHSLKERDFTLPPEKQLPPHPPSSMKLLKPQKYTLKRPGSAGSTRPSEEDVQSPQHAEHLKETAQEVTKYMTKLIEDTSTDPSATMSTSAEVLDSVPPMLGPQKRQRSASDAQKSLFQTLGASTHPTTGQSSAVAVPAPFAQPTGNAKSKIKKYSEKTRSKLANKSTDSSGTTSSEGGTSGSTKSSDGGSETAKPSTDTTAHNLSSDAGDGASGPAATPEKVKEVARTESMCSTHSSLSGISFGPGYTLPSRNHSFSVYDGGGESSPHSHESFEISDSRENLELLEKLGYSPYIPSIYFSRKHDTTSSSDEDSAKHQGYHGRRKRSSGAVTSVAAEGVHKTPHRKDDQSNSSCDSDQPHFPGGERAAQSVRREESISISDIEKYSTDMEVEEKVAALQKGLGRVRYSSTGSVKICYSGSTTSMEEIGKNM